jgi:hypothetical protein
VISRFARLRRPAPRQLSLGERAWFVAGLFFATIAVVMFAGTLPPPAPVFVGMGWTVVLLEADRWARPLGG